MMVGRPGCLGLACIVVTAWLYRHSPWGSINLQDQDLNAPPNTYHANDVASLVLEDSFQLSGGSLGRHLCLSPTAISLGEMWWPFLPGSISQLFILQSKTKS